MTAPMLLGAALFLAGMITGRWWPARRRGPKPPKPVQPVCGCTHHHSFHDPVTGECHGKMKGKPIRFDVSGYAVAYDRIACTCRQYSGPQPLPEFFAPQIAEKP